MRARALFRIAGVLLLLFAAGHTVGFLTFTAPNAEGRAAWHAMNTATFLIHGQHLSYGGFYVGFGLFLTAFQLFAAFLAWRMAALSDSSAPGLPALTWAFVLLQSVSLALSLLFFAWPPALLSALAGACLAAAAVAQRKRQPQRA